MTCESEMKAWRKQWLLRLAYLVVTMGSSGCTGAAAWVYPTVARTPSVSLESTPDTIHVFRVDHDLTDPLGFSNETGRTDTNVTFQRLEVGETIPAQYGLGLCRGYYRGIGGWGAGYEYSNTVTVRLYRPGYFTVERKAWEPSQKIDWQPASSYFAQVAALEQLVSSNEVHRYWGVKPGSVDRRHREALSFIASEFERFVRTYPDAEVAAAPADPSSPWGLNIQGYKPKEHIQESAFRYRRLAAE